jgi:phospholipase/carboxylesterase
MNTLQHDEASHLSFRVRPANGRPRGRLFLLHGVGGNETNLMPLADSLPGRLELVFVRGPLTLGPAQHAWFQVRFSADGPVINADQADASRLALLELVRQFREADGPAPVPALMAGFSQGGILSASVALSAPDDIARFAILSGRILPELAPHLAAREKLANVARLSHTASTTTNCTSGLPNTPTHGSPHSACRTKNVFIQSATC